ncbi:MAG: DUF3291 domain-containing protein [Daejeonella sp.]
MIVSLTIVRYKSIFIPVALMAMAIHRLPLYLNKKCGFWKLMGSGKNGTFDINPDWRQWGLLATWATEDDFQQFYSNSFISKWWRLFGVERWTMLSKPLVSHGKWDGKEPFKVISSDIIDKNYNGPIAVLTRARVRLSRLKNFWSHVDPVASIMQTAPGFITSFGVGEAPLFLQATFSIWDSVENVKNFAYQSKEHAEVIIKTRKEDWYSEELFARFIPLKTIGTLNGIDPLNGLFNQPHIKQ